MHRQVTDRRSGTHIATLPPDGGDGLVVRRHRRRRVRPLGRASRSPAARPPRTGRGRRAGPARRRGRLPGRAGDRPRAWSPSAPPPTTAPGSGCGARDGPARGRLRPRRGRRRRRALRGRDAAGDLATPSTATRGTRRCGCVRAADGSAVAEKSDGPGQGPDPARVRPGPRRPAAAAPARAPRPRGAADLGRRCGHRDRARPRPARRGRRRLLPRTRRALLVWHTHAARTRLHRYDLATGELTDLPTAAGLRGLGRRPPGRHGRVLVLVGGAAADRPRPAHRTARTACCSPRRATRAPGSVPVEDLWVDGPGGPVHALVARPEAGHGPGPAVFSLHGGPHAADEDRFSAVRAVWVDAGFAVVEVNYRGSTGYGSHLARRHRGPAGADRAGGRRRRASTRASPQGLVDPRAVRGRGLVVGRLPGAAGGRHAAGALGRRRWPGCRWPTTSPPTPTRWSSCARSTGRCSAGRRRSGPTPTGRRRR